MSDDCRMFLVALRGQYSVAHIVAESAGEAINWFVTDLLDCDILDATLTVARQPDHQVIKQCNWGEAPDVCKTAEQWCGELPKGIFLHDDGSDY